MSWSEVSKINNNFKKSLNEQLRDNRFMGYYLFPLSTINQTATWTAPEAGWYKVFCVGAGSAYSTTYADTTRYTASGAVSVKNYHFDKGEAVTLGYKTFSGGPYPNAYFGDSQRAQDATQFEVNIASGITPAQAYGGDYNYNGQVGIYTNGVGVDVGVYVAELSQAVEKQATYANLAYRGSIVHSVINSETVRSGVGILGYGGSVAYKLLDATTQRSATVQGKGACVLIIPLEFE